MYVLDSLGKKVYKFAASASAKREAAAAPPPAASPKNALGRKIFKGPKGGEYVLDSKGKKVYKFKKAAVVPKPGEVIEIATNENGYSSERPSVVLSRAKIEVPQIVFSRAKFEKKFSSRTISVWTSSGFRKNVFVVRGSNVDALAPWFANQAKFIGELSMDDFLTVAAYTNKSHSWIGPYLTGGRVKNLKYVSNSFAKPLFPQMKKILDSSNRVPDIDSVLWDENDAAPRPSTRGQELRRDYATFADKKKSNAERYKAYEGVYSLINKRYMKLALDAYVEDLQSIILRSPPIQSPVFLYRGSFTMYMKLDRKDTVNAFSSASFVPSYSLGYGTAGYHRIELVRGSHALALAIVNPWNSTGEYEILLPIGTEYAPKYDRTVKRWIVRNDRKNVVTHTVSNFTAKTP